MKYKEELEEMVQKGLTIKQIASNIGLSGTGTRYWLKKNGIKTKGHYRFKKWNEQDLRDFISKSKTKSDVIRKMGLLLRPGNFKTLDRYVKIHNIDISHFDRYFHNNRFNNRKYTNEEMFIANSSYTNGKGIKNRLIREGLKEYKCEKCGNIGEWNGEKLNLQIDHINGINTDNSIDNLRFLCPNCHSQTETFCSKNRDNGKVVNMVITAD